MGASTCSKHGKVRQWMVRIQQELSQKTSMVLDGRDIGLRVLPEATLKIFLTASPEVRATRRWKELQASGAEGSYQEVLEDIIRRDEQDTTRTVDPLMPVTDAVMMDSSSMTRAEVVDTILRLLEKSKGRCNL